ncbi:MAG: DUF1080 domain-containing protein [Planctomycetaceae bacterium]|jgi:hypothetical protein|nr:DUF1080 domain-containing protein [Planctomycetaceae bacterium]
MKTTKTIISILIVTFSITTISFADDKPAAKKTTGDGFKQIFNGKDLTGWEGMPDVWRVESGCIVAESTPEKPCKAAHYLSWKDGEPDNFHLKLSFRLQGNGNSGIQFRSKKRPNWDVYGYQADVEAGSEWTGCLFHSSRAAVIKRGFEGTIDAKGTPKFKQFANPAELIKSYKKGDWNEYEIIAVGHKITLLINGKKMCQVEDLHATEAATSGIIALQMHPGPPMKIEFKNIQLKKITANDLDSK